CIVFVLKGRKSAAGRDDRQKSAFDVDARDGCLEIGDITLHLLMSDVADRLTADVDDRRRPACGRTAEVLRGPILGVELRESLLVAPARSAHRNGRILRFLGSRSTLLESLDPLFDVPGPTTALPELPVADDVHAGLGLLAHNIRNRVRQAGIERSVV